MQEQIDQLNQKITDLEAKLTLAGMSFELRELIRNEVIKGLDTSQTALTKTYVDSHGDTVIAPNAYAGLIVIKSRGVEYKIPYI